MAGRNSQVARIYCILDILSLNPQGMSAADIHLAASERGHKASKRTVYRDLELLAEAGFPLLQQGDKDLQGGVRWIFEKNTKVSNYLVLDYRELLGLYIARSALAPLKETPFYQDIDRVFEKITAKMSSKALDLLSELSTEIIFEPGPKWGLGLSSDVLDTVQAACSEQHWLEFSYRGVNDESANTRLAGPQFLYFAKGSLYLVAKDSKDGKIKLFSLPRMSHAKMMGEAYTEEQINPEEFFSASFGIFKGSKTESVVLDCSPTIAPYVRERSWHKSQRVVAKADGSISLHLDVAITPDLINWILSFGANVKVSSPASLIELVTKEAQSVIEQYSKRAA